MSYLARVYGRGFVKLKAGFFEFLFNIAGQTDMESAGGNCGGNVADILKYPLFQGKSSIVIGVQTTPQGFAKSGAGHQDGRLTRADGSYPVFAIRKNEENLRDGQGFMHRPAFPIITFQQAAPGRERVSTVKALPVADNQRFFIATDLICI